MYFLKDSCAGCPAVFEILTHRQEIQCDPVFVARLRKVSIHWDGFGALLYNHNGQIRQIVPRLNKCGWVYMLHSGSLKEAKFIFFSHKSSVF